VLQKELERRSEAETESQQSTGSSIHKRSTPESMGKEVYFRILIYRSRIIGLVFETFECKNEIGREEYIGKEFNFQKGSGGGRCFANFRRRVAVFDGRPPRR